jgi:hypothetical protein
MAKITLSILLFFLAMSGQAKCIGSSIRCVTTSAALNKNGLIILEFYGFGSALVNDLNKKYPIFLKSTSAKVSLSVVEVLVGEMNLTQVVLKPIGELKVGSTYELRIDNLPDKAAQPLRESNRNGGLEKIVFKISASIDVESPILRVAPKEQKKSMVHFGCGPAIWVYFNIAGKDQSELFVRTTFKHKASGKTTTYILLIKDGMVGVGHGMCSGAFQFDDGDNYEVSFQLFDQSGNKGVLTSAIEFTKPTKETN